MSKFGETLFGGSPFVRWALSPFLLLFVFLMPVLINRWTPAAMATLLGMECVCIALLAGFWLPKRFGHWAFRVVAGMVFLACVGYLVQQFFFGDVPFRLIGRRAESSPRNALLAFLTFGLPCLWYAVFGRFTGQKPPTDPSVYKSSESDD